MARHPGLVGLYRTRGHPVGTRTRLVPGPLSVGRYKLLWAFQIGLGLAFLQLIPSLGI